ncbi:hypothetical protein ABZ729_32665 [Streptomyces sp. NPDC006678]|uniref:hypothetical protein n=1 Tax=Streptomyces sp. NPDC006678 TaxID=3157185 RepID=UPI0033CB55BF
MTKLGYAAATAAALAVTMLTGCTAQGAAAPASSPTAAKSSPPAVMTVVRALRDIRYATKGVGEDRLRILEDPRAAAEGVAPCTAAGPVLTREIPGAADLARVTGRLEARGWKLDTPLDPQFTSLSFGKWNIMLGAGPIPKESAALAGKNKGAFGIQVSGVCKKPS